MQVERVIGDPDTIAYLEKDVARNALDIKSLLRNDKRYDLYVCRSENEIKAHLGCYTAPEAVYVGLVGEPDYAEKLLHLVPNRGVVITTNSLRDLVARKTKHDLIYTNYLMSVTRGEQKFRN